MLDKSFRRDVFLRQLGAAKPRLLMVDYGALLPGSSPQRHAMPLPGLEHLLQRVARLADTRVVLISDCDARTVAVRLSLEPAPEIWGVGGMQRLLPNGQCELAPFEERSLQGLAQADDWAERAGLGARLAQKPGAVAVHFNSLVEQVAGEVTAWLRAEAVQHWSDIALQYDLHLRHFEDGIELRVPARERADIVRILLAEIGPSVSVAYLGTGIPLQIAGALLPLAKAASGTQFALGWLGH